MSHNDAYRRANAKGCNAVSAGNMKINAHTSICIISVKRSFFLTLFIGAKIVIFVICCLIIIVYFSDFSQYDRNYIPHHLPKGWGEVCNLLVTAVAVVAFRHPRC